ncbi:unnamed protein product [Ascophyllum nodosum]
MEMSRLTRDGTAEPISRDQILRPARGQRNIHFPCSADHEQDWQPYPVDPYSAICDDHTYIRTYIVELCLMVWTTVSRAHWMPSRVSSPAVLAMVVAINHILHWSIKHRNKP